MDDKTKTALQAQLSSLPKVVQRAITSADVEKELRELAGLHKLHLDQWQLLQEEVILVLLGLHPIDELEKNIERNVGVTPEIAQALMKDVARIVFEPIREELERELGAPQAHEENLSDMEKVRREAISAATESGTGASQSDPASVVPAANIPAPATPPAPPPTQKVVRSPNSGAYISGETSVARANVVDDPYREPPR